MKIDKRYDLKGSTQGRETILKEGEVFDPTIAMKDLDFLKAKEKFKLEGDVKRKLLDTLRKDTEFFAKCEIIDYSLLIGVHVRNLHMPSSHRADTEQSEYNSPIPSAGQHFMNSYDRYSNTSLMG